MKRVIRLTESDLTRIVKQVIMEEENVFMTNNYRSPNLLFEFAKKRVIFSPELKVANDDFAMWSDEVPRENFYWEVSIQKRDKTDYNTRMMGEVQSEIQLTMMVSEKWYFDKIKKLFKDAASNTTTEFTPEKNEHPNYKYGITTSRKFIYYQKNPLGGDSKTDTIYELFRNFLSQTLEELSRSGY